MKLKYLFLSLVILILTCSIAAIAANEAVIDDYKFTVPDNYTIVNSTEHFVSLELDKDHTIKMSCLDEAKSPEQFKADLESDGYKIDGDESNFTAGIFDVRQNEISKDKIKGYLYICEDTTDEDGDDEVFVTFTCKGDHEDFKADNQTVADLLDSIQKVDD